MADSKVDVASQALARLGEPSISAFDEDSDTAEIARNQLGATQRKIISMPPDHGARLVADILGDADLRKMCVDELTEMRERMRDLRKQLSAVLNVQGGETMAAAVIDQNGMFSTLPLSVDQARKLRSDFSIYMTDSGRINIAGANSAKPRIRRATPESHGRSDRRRPMARGTALHDAASQPHAGSAARHRQVNRKGASTTNYPGEKS